MRTSIQASTWPRGDSRAGALIAALGQWADGPYWAYHDAFAHDDHPSFEFEQDGVSWHAFEAPLQTLGAAESVPAITALSPTRALLTSLKSSALSEFRAHRLRWVFGASGVAEVMLDDEPQPELVERLRSLVWPEPAPFLIRHSAVLLARGRSEERRRHNLSFVDAQQALQKAAGLTEAGREATLLSALQHGIELEPAGERVPELCLRWSRLAAARARTGSIARALDAPLSRGLLDAYGAMASGDSGRALDFLTDSLSRSSKLSGSTLQHLRALSSLYAEYALPARNDAIIKCVRQLAGEPVSGPVELATSSLEAPSAVASVREVLPGLKLSVSEMGEPDPRLPTTASATRLWTYAAEGLLGRLLKRLSVEGRPAYAAPSGAVSSRLAALASSEYSRLAWRDRASGLKRELGVGVHRELLAAMVHPPKIAHADPWDSRFRVMVAAALTLAQSVEGPLASSEAGRLLVGLLDGPVDWATTAATIALTDLALFRPELEAEIIELFVTRLTIPLSPVRYQCFVEPTCWVLLRLPHLPDVIQNLALHTLTGEGA